MLFSGLYLFKRFFVDDSLMGILDEVHVQVFLISNLLSGQEVWCIGFLHQEPSDVLFVAQHSVNRGCTPFGFPGHCFDPMFLQISFDFTDSIALKIERKNLSHDLRFFRYNTQHSICALSIAKKL